MVAAEFYRSRMADAFTFSPVFFYHLPKCAGMMFHATVKAAWTLLLDCAGAEPPLVERADVAASIDELRAFSNYALISSHLPFGAHRSLPGKPALMTFVREPVDRVRSAFTYGCMRRGIAARRQDFPAFMRREENRNLMTKLLAGIDARGPADADNLARARDNLEGHFDHFAPHTGVGEGLRTYLRRCGLPNVISGRVNRTADHYRIGLDDFAGEVAEANALDVELHRFVEGNARLLPCPADDGRPHPLTVVMRPDDRPGRPMGEASLCSTGSLFQEPALLDRLGGVSSSILASL